MTMMGIASGGSASYQMVGIDLTGVFIRIVYYFIDNG
ncbi:MAG: hypothetical protein ACJAZ6_002404 [Oleispira sp.]|jgi:hypothetical protein